MEVDHVNESADENEVRRLRKAAGYATQDEAARRFGYGLRTWAAWELGERPPPQPVLELLEIEAAQRAGGAQEGTSDA